MIVVSGDNLLEYRGCTTGMQVKVLCGLRGENACTSTVFQDILPVPMGLPKPQMSALLLYQLEEHKGRRGREGTHGGRQRRKTHTEYVRVNTPWPLGQILFAFSFCK